MLRMIAGKRFSNDKNSPDSDENEAFHKWVEDLFEILCGRSNIADFLPSLGFIDSKEWNRKVNSMSSFRDQFFQKLIDNVRNNTTVDEYKKTMVTNMLSLQSSDPKYYTDETIIGFAVSMVAAGTDTVSNTIEWVLTLLLNNPDKLEKLRAEIDEKVGKARLVEESDVQNLPYLVRVVNETLRLKPAGPMMVPHEASEDCKVGGYEIKKGTMLMVNAYRIHRDPDTWVEPERFEPERYEEGKYDAGKTLIFGMGRMRCPGEALARRVVGSVLGAMVQCFEWERIGDGLEDMTESTAVAMGKEVPLEAMYRPRKTMMGVLGQL